MRMEFGSKNGSDPSPPATPPGSLAARMRAAHEQLEQGIAALGDLARIAIRPAGDVLARARWQLGAASRARLIVSTEVLAALTPRARLAHERIELDRVAALNANIRQFTSLYVQTWTPERVAADWPGYCAASREKRELLTEVVRVEREQLYPLLRRAGL